MASFSFNGKDVTTVNLLVSTRITALRERGVEGFGEIVGSEGGRRRDYEGKKENTGDHKLC